MGWSAAARPCCCRPCTASWIPRRLAAWSLADRLPVRVQLQLHKYVWGDDARGV